MSFERGAPSSDYAPLPTESTNNQGGGSDEHILRSAGWLRGFRIDDVKGPQITMRQVASCVDGAVPFIEEANNLSTDIIMTETEREANYVHHGWSVGATRTISPWTSSRIAANNQADPESGAFTRLIKSKRLGAQILLEDLTPVPEFEAAIKEALGRLTTFEKFQAIYRALSRWGDVVPLEVEIGSSIALTGDDLSCVQPSEMGERGCGSISRLSMIKNAVVTITGANPGLSYEQWAAMDAQSHQADRIAVKKVVPTIALLSSDIQIQLSELYAQRLSYVPPYGIGRIRHCHRTYDDNQHASRTISSVTIRSSDYIELLSITYSDGTVSSKHGGGGHVGTEYKFTLGTGEHIIEMLTWASGGWLLGLQFVTSTGRCSPQYGVHLNEPSVARAKGGVLVGFLSQTDQHPRWKEMFSGVQGIWRHDILPRVPKEDDVYSEYFGDRDSKWEENAFNDRELVGNSKSIYISSIKIWSSEGIDSVQFIYNDKKDRQEFKSTSKRHGGPGGSLHQFVLEDGENIVTVSGRHGEQHITQLCFGTNRGRTSEVYGAGKGQSFSALAPRDRDGNYYRLHYICGKNSDVSLTGVMFVWTPC